MKGTFLSADFVEDSSGNLRFLELNTDTAANSDFTDASGVWDNFISLISGSTLTGTPITEVHVIYKPAAQQNIVNSLSQSLFQNLPSVTSFVTYTEDLETIYPTSVDDADNKFILRLAYDENAILDSLYCKDGSQALLLFNDNDDLDSCVPYYFSGSVDYVNNILPNLNDNSFPDFVIKSNNPAESVRFIKAGPYLSGSTYVSSSEFDSDRISNFTSSLNLGDNGYVMNYMFPTETTTDGAVSSIRTYHIVYGGALTTLNLGGVRTYAPFSLPTGSQIDWNDSTDVSVEIGKEHYHEFSTSNLKEQSYVKPGAFETEKLISSSGEAIDVEFVYDNYSSSVIELQTYFISGSPDTDNPSEYLQWRHEGSTLPVGSYITSSVVTNVFKVEQPNFTLSALKVSGSDSIQYVSPISNLLVYESSSNQTKFMPVKSINANDPAGYYSYNTDGTLRKIVENEYVIMQSGTTGSFYSTDVESFDYYFVGDLGSVAMGIHNFYCFPAGTKITVDGGYVNIEDVKVGDVVLSFNEETKETEYKEVTGLKQPVHDDLVKYTFSNGTELICTFDHPLYVNGLDIASFIPEWTNRRYEIGREVTKTKISDIVRLDNKSHSVISNIEVLEPVSTQTYIIEVKDNHNFFANGILVHNKPML